MMRQLPGKHDKKWLWIWALLTLLVLSFISAGRAWVAGAGMNGMVFLRIFLFSLVLSLVICLFGFLNARIMFIFSALGVLLGLILMMYEFNRDTGWELITGMIVFSQITALGFCVGVGGQLADYIIKRMKK